MEVLGPTDFIFKGSFTIRLKPKSNPVAIFLKHAIHSFSHPFEFENRNHSPFAEIDFFQSHPSVDGCVDEVMTRAQVG